MAGGVVVFVPEERKGLSNVVFKQPSERENGKLKVVRYDALLSGGSLFGAIAFEDMEQMVASHPVLF